MTEQNRSLMPERQLRRTEVIDIAEKGAEILREFRSEKSVAHSYQPDGSLQKGNMHYTPWVQGDYDGDKVYMAISGFFPKINKSWQPKDICEYIQLHIVKLEEPRSFDNNNLFLLSLYGKMQTSPTVKHEEHSEVIQVTSNIIDNISRSLNEQYVPRSKRVKTSNNPLINIANALRGYTSKS